MNCGPPGMDSGIHMQCNRPKFDPWVGKIPWRRKWQPMPVFLPGESHGQRSLLVYSPWCCRVGHWATNTFLLLSNILSHNAWLVLSSKETLFKSSRQKTIFIEHLYEQRCIAWFKHGSDAVRFIFKYESLLAQSCPALCDSMNCSPPGSSVHGILQARKLAWVAISFSRGSLRPRNLTQVSCIAGRFFTNWDTKKVLVYRQ